MVKADAKPAGLLRMTSGPVVFIQESSRAQLAELARLVDDWIVCARRSEPSTRSRRRSPAYSTKAAGGIPGRIVLQP